MKITAVPVERPEHDIGGGWRAELCEGVSTVLAPRASGLGITPDEGVIAGQRAARLAADIVTAVARQRA